MIDSHMHTVLCGHATGTLEQYIAQAHTIGLEGVIFTEHCPMPSWFDPESRMRYQDLEPYHQQLQAARDSSPIWVGIGLEADYHPGTEYAIADLRQRHSYDYMIGSVHFIGAWGFDHPDHKDEFERRNLRSVYHDYFAQIKQAAQTGLFDAIGHLDLPKKFGHIPAEGYLDFAQEALETIAKANLALDVNTAGWRKPINELYPSKAVLQQALALNIPVVLGSDAHSPLEVGHRFNDAAQLLKEVGYTQACYYKQGQRVYYNL